MKSLKNLTPEMAQKICSLVGKPFLKIDRQSEEKVIIITSKEKVEKDVTTYCIEISQNGMIEFTYEWSDDENGYSELQSMNTLPIIDYLREVGYEFIY